MISLSGATLADATAMVAELFDSFVEDLVQQGMDRHVAVDSADVHLRQLLPQGPGTTGHRFRWVDDDGQRIGRTWFGPVPNSPGEYYLYEISVDDRARGRGSGRSVIEIVIRELASEGAERLGLSVFSSNVAAMALYRSLGFEAAGQSRIQLEMWYRFDALG